VERQAGAAGIRRQIEEALPALVKELNPAGIGVGFGGPVDWKAGRICRSHQIEGWSEFDLAVWLGDLSGVDTIVDNDANVAALGEAVRGAGQGFDPSFYVTLGSGVGGGLTQGEKIYHGATPGEAEIGHVRLDRQGTTVESRCSGWAVDQRIRVAVAKSPEGTLARMVKSAAGNEARHLAAALAEDDRLAHQILSEISQDLAFALSHVAHLFHPGVIILGGGLSKVGEPLRTGVEKALPQFVMEAFHPCPAIRLAALGEDSVPVGALVLAGQNRR
jgi:glucokinase